MKRSTGKTGPKVSSRKPISRTEHSLILNSSLADKVPTLLLSSSSSARAVEQQLPANHDNSASILSASTLSTYAALDTHNTPSQAVSGRSHSLSVTNGKHPSTRPETAEPVPHLTRLPSSSSTTTITTTTTTITTNSSPPTISSSSSSATTAVPADGDIHYFELNDAYYSEIRRRADILVEQKIATYQMDVRTDNHGYRGLLKRKYGHIWQTRMMFDRISINAGYFDHPVCAAVAYDIAQTFLRPSLKNGNGSLIELNFPRTIADCRIFPMVPTEENGLIVTSLDRPGVPTEDGHFWTVDEEYYREIKRRSEIILRQQQERQQQSITNQGSNTTSSSSSSSSGHGENPNYIGIQKHKRKLDDGFDTYTYEAKLIYRRKWFYLGRFRTVVEAAVSYDYGTTFIRPFGLKTEGNKPSLNFPGTVSDCRIEPPIDPWPQHVQEAMDETNRLPAPRLPRMNDGSSSSSSSSRSNNDKPVNTGTIYGEPREDRTDGTGEQSSSKRRRGSDTVDRSGTEFDEASIPSSKPTGKEGKRKPETRPNNLGGSLPFTVSSTQGRKTKETPHHGSSLGTSFGTKDYGGTGNVSASSASSLLSVPSLLQNHSHSLSTDSILDLLVAANEMQTPLVQGTEPPEILGPTVQGNSFEPSPSHRSTEKMGQLLLNVASTNPVPFGSSSSSLGPTSDAPDFPYSSAFTPRNGGIEGSNPVNHPRTTTQTVVTKKEPKDGRKNGSNSVALGGLPPNHGTNGTYRLYREREESPSIVPNGSGTDSASQPSGTDTQGPSRAYANPSQPSGHPPPWQGQANFHHPFYPTDETWYRYPPFAAVPANVPPLYSYPHPQPSLPLTTNNGSSNNLLTVIPPLSQQPYLPAYPSSSLPFGTGRIPSVYPGTMLPTNYNLPHPFTGTSNGTNGQIFPPSMIVHPRYPANNSLSKSSSVNSLSFVANNAGGHNGTRILRESPSTATELSSLPRPSLDPQHFHPPSMVGTGMDTGDGRRSALASIEGSYLGTLPSTHGNGTMVKDRIGPGIEPLESSVRSAVDATESLPHRTDSNGTPIGNFLISV